MNSLLSYFLATQAQLLDFVLEWRRLRPPVRDRIGYAVCTVGLLLTWSAFPTQLWLLILAVLKSQGIETGDPVTGYEITMLTIGVLLLLLGLVVLWATAHDKQALATTPKLELDSLENIKIFLGSSGMSAEFNRTRFEKNSTSFPYLGNEFPVTAFFEDGEFYIDASVWVGGDPGDSIQIHRNVLAGLLPDGWDLNKNAEALEIVDRDLQPFFQLVRNRPGTVTVQGVFTNGSSIFVADQVGIEFNPSTVGLSIDRIFKYPAWKYHGVVDETEDTVELVA